MHPVTRSNNPRAAMDTDKIKIFGARVKVDSTGKLAELERAEKVRTSSFMVKIVANFGL